MSANSAVTVLRSASRLSSPDASATRIAASLEILGETAAIGTPSAAPHSPQKRFPAGLSASHFGQRFGSGAPQSPQNFLPDGLSVLQFGQRIALTEKENPPLVYHRRHGGNRQPGMTTAGQLAQSGQCSPSTA